jgi:hypothetical protein
MEGAVHLINEGKTPEAQMARFRGATKEEFSERRQRKAGFQNRR